MKRSLTPYSDILVQAASAIWLASTLSVLLLAAQTSILGMISPVVGSAGRIAEISGLILIGLLFLGRRRYQNLRTLFILDGVRQLLAFGALFLNELYRYSLAPSRGSTSIRMISSLFGLQAALIIIMIVVSSLLHTEQLNVSRK